MVSGMTLNYKLRLTSGAKYSPRQIYSMIPHFAHKYAKTVNYGHAFGDANYFYDYQPIVLGGKVRHDDH